MSKTGHLKEIMHHYNAEFMSPLEQVAILYDRFKQKTTNIMKNNNIINHNTLYLLAIKCNGLCFAL